MKLDSQGMPVLELADLPGREVPTRSGNPSHDHSTGQFAPRHGGKKQAQPKERKGADPLPNPHPRSPDSIMRRRDAVIDAARTIREPTPEAIREFVTRRWNGKRALTPLDIEQFEADMRRQRLDDLVDGLDAKLREATSQGDAIKVVMPRGWMRQYLSTFDRGEIDTALQRLRHRGWSAAQIKTHVLRPMTSGELRKAKVPDIELSEGDEW